MKKRNKKSIALPIIITCSVLFLALVVGAGIYFYPRLLEKYELKKLNTEINSLLKENNLETIKSITKENITSHKRLEVEKKVEEYLINTKELQNKVDILYSDEKLNSILSTLNLNEDISIIDNSLKELEDLKNSINKVKEDSKKTGYIDKKLDNLYNSLISKIDLTPSIGKIDDMSSYLNEVKSIFAFLKENASKYKVEDNKIIFLKRAAKEEYDKLVSEFKYLEKSNIVFELIEDKTGPVITASNQTVNVGTKLDLAGKIKCVDDVDDTVECSISGTYDTSKAGTYKITITSTDKTGNKSSKTITVTVKEVPKSTGTVTSASDRKNTSNKPYYIEVIRNQNVVIVYGLDENKQYSKVVKVFVCSAGKGNNTPTGTFKTTKGYNWGALFGGVYGQYSTRITGHILFHSVPYYSKNKGDLEWEEYNKLGTKASAGCIRMTVRDVKWIFDNVANGTTVRIYDGNLPNGVSKPSAPKIPADSPNRGWDPTDPDPNNPWNK